MATATLEAKRNGYAASPNQNNRTIASTEPVTLASDWRPSTPSGSFVAIITPALAENLLGTITKQRPRMTRLVNRIASDIRDGRWVYDGAAILFDTSFSLINGQHRLAAIVAANTPVVARIEWGVSPDAFEVVDGGISRQNRDVLSVEGVKNPATAAAVFRNIAGYKHGVGFSGRVTVSNRCVMELSRQHPGVYDCVDFVCNNSDMRRMQPPNVTAFLLYVFRQIDAEQANKFFTDVSLGADLSVGDPRFAYRRLLENMRQRGSMAKNNLPTLAAYGIKAWNAWRSGAQVSQLKYGDNEVFPTPI